MDITSQLRLRKIANRLIRISESKWVQDAVEHPGRLHKHFGIPEDQTIPQAKINKEIARLHKKKESKGSLSKEETSLLRALNLGKRLKKMKK